MGMLDTGATRTCVDFIVAEKLSLIPVGVGHAQTAAGLKQTPDYAIDINFIGSNLRQILNLKIGSCNLGFKFENVKKNSSDPRNIGILIGRDIMSLWHITWHGPTSTVFISD